jgi:hypothetical protein
MLRLEIGFLELDLMWPIFYVQRGIRISAIRTGKFRGHFVKFEAFDVQAFSNMTLFQFHRSDTFPFLMLYIPATPTIVSRGNPILVQ